MRVPSLGLKHPTSLAESATGGAPTASPAALIVENLHAYYGPAQALDGVSLRVEPGQVLGLVGNNGAGKTTLLRTIGGLHRRATGRVEYAGASLLGRRPDEIAIRGVGLVRDGGRVFENLTISDHLTIAARLGRKRLQGVRDMGELLDMFPVLAQRGAETKAGYLSGGQRQLLCLAMAVGSGAGCLLLDEPSAGLADSTATDVFAIIRRFADQGLTLLIAEQDVRWLSALTDQAAELEMGRIIRFVDT